MLTKKKNQNQNKSINDIFNNIFYEVKYLKPIPLQNIRNQTKIRTMVSIGAGFGERNVLYHNWIN